MNNITLIVIGITLGVGAATMCLLPLLKKKGVQIQQVLRKADTVLKGVDATVNIAGELLPNNPVIPIINIIKEYAKEGVHEAEQLYITSEIGEDERKDKSKEGVYSILKMLKIESTPEIEKIIDSAITAECLALGHKEKTQQELADENIRLKQENENLKNVVNQIKGIVPAQ